MKYPYGLVALLIMTLAVVSTLSACSNLNKEIFERSQVGYYYGKGVTSVKERHYKKALAILDKGLKESRNSGLYSLRGYCLLKVGKFSKACDDINMSFKYRDSERFNIASINRHLSKVPYYKEAFLYGCRSLAYSYLEEHDKALADADKAIELEPKYSDWYCIRALARKHRGEADLALQDLAKAIELSSKNPNPYKVRSDLYSSMGEEKKEEAKADGLMAEKLGYKPKNDLTEYEFK